MKNKFFCLILIVFISYIWVYRNLILNSQAVWGDAPYYYVENLKELFNKPFLWDSRNNNFGSSQALTLWLFLPTFLVGLFSSLFHLDGEIFLKLIFYIPATSLALIGSWLYFRFITKDNIASLVGAFLYGFNTYFLTLLDGGQVGVSLAYGLFPLVVLFCEKYFEYKSKKNLFFSLFFLFILSNVDLRIWLIALLFIALSRLIKNNFRKALKNLLFFTLSIFLIIVLDSFWVLPFITSGVSSYSLPFSLLTDKPFTSLTNALFLYQPHFPLNEFGHLFNTPFYFGFLPLLFFLGLLIRIKDKNISIKFIKYLSLYLLFAFFTKGSNDPFGIIYKIIVDKVPLGASFRDSSKFFIPLFFAAGTILSLFLVKLKFITKSRRLFDLIIFSVIAYLIFLIHPAFLGKMTGVLGKRNINASFQNIYSFLRGKESFRTLWFPERLPLGFADWAHPAVSANLLYQDRPFASQINGTYDYYDFLHRENIKEWLKLLGVKYLFFPNDERKKTWSAEEKINRGAWENFVSELPGFKKLDWSISFPGLYIDNSMPRIFSQKKAFLVLGGEDVYDKLFLDPQFNLSSQGFIFADEGKVDFGSFTNIDNSDLVVLNNTSDLNSTVLFNLQKNFISPRNAKKSQWVTKDSNQYMDWKYELFKGGIVSKDFDFGKGVSYSSIKGESIVFDIKVPEENRYFLALRSVESTKSTGIKVSFNNYVQVIRNNEFKWNMLGPLHLKRGKDKLIVENLGGMVSLNTIALIKEKDYLFAKEQSESILKKFKVINVSDPNSKKELEREFNGNSERVEYLQVNPTEYHLKLNDLTGRWLVFTDHFDKEWEIKGINRPYPFYAMVNGFYTNNLVGEVSLKYSKQRIVALGIYISIFSAFMLISAFLFLYFKEMFLRKYKV